MTSFQNVGNGEHETEGATVVAATHNGAPLQGIGELQELELSQPVALLKGGKGVGELKG